MSEQNLDIHIPADHSWISGYADSMGWEPLAAYYNRVYLRLMEMQPGDKLEVRKLCKPENYDLFLKCAVTAMEELEQQTGRTFYIEGNGDIILKR